MYTRLQQLATKSNLLSCNCFIKVHQEHSFKELFCLNKNDIQTWHIMTEHCLKFTAFVSANVLNSISICKRLFRVSSECVETLQPPISKELVRPVSRVLVASSGWCAEIGQHEPVFLSLCCSLSIFLIIIPEERENRRDESLQSFL